MTAYADLKLRARANAHDITDPSATITGKDVAERAVSRKVYNMHISDDADATTARTSLCAIGFPESEYPNGALVKSITLRSAAITPHAENHFTDTFSGVGTDGVADTTVATLTSDADVAIGSGGLGAVASTANKPYSALMGTVANCTVVAGGSLSLARAKAGAGVTLGETSYEIVVEAL